MVAVVGADINFHNLELTGKHVHGGANGSAMIMSRGTTDKE